MMIGLRSLMLLVLCALVLGSQQVLAQAPAPGTTTAPQVASCLAGTSYQPGCDVNQNGAITLTDIQLVAAKWNRSGSYTTDGWRLTGNAGTSPGTHFVGTSDGQPLVIQPGAGNVGIHTTTPRAAFHVNGTSWFQGDSTPLPTGAGTGIAIGTTSTFNYIFAYNYASNLPSDLVLQSPGGSLRVGTTTPSTARLQVAGASSPVNAPAISATSPAPDGTGIIGIANTGSQAYGVWGRSSSGYAGYFEGNVEVTGVLTKMSGGTKLDHPLDPANQYLYHASVESPDMKNIYDGVVTLDKQGMAVVTLPAWFEALNQTFRYQLTAIGAPGPNLYIAEKIKGNQFTIAGGSPSMEVSWQVTGIRHDPYAEAHRLPAEQAKAAHEQGTYLHPELYGQPESRGVNSEKRRQLSESEKAD
jgi:hypothetical protein